jgi:phage terminase large subunit-like protein
MIEGESGILAVSPGAERPAYKPSNRELRWPSGAKGFTYSAEEPERLRGPQHSCAWLDEIAAYPDLKEVWDLLLPGLRLGSDPRRICTTTPKPSPFLKAMIADSTTVISRMRTRDNRANLAPGFVEELDRIYAGTRIGRQELEGELLEGAEGALWRLAQIDALRVRQAPELVRVVVAIDPSVTSGPDSDEVGIVAAGLGADGHGYVLRDLSGRMSPDDWAQRAVVAFDHLDADKIIAEANNGGDLIISVMRTVRTNIAIEKVHAARGKITRAEPVAALYEQGRIHHAGAFPQLEDEMTNYVPGVSKSPNRMDALVWAISYLMLKPARVGRALAL